MFWHGSWTCRWCRTSSGRVSEYSLSLFRSRRHTVHVFACMCWGVHLPVKDINATNFSCCIFIWLILLPSGLYHTLSCLLQFTLHVGVCVYFEHVSVCVCLCASEWATRSCRYHLGSKSAGIYPNLPCSVSREAAVRMCDVCVCVPVYAWTKNLPSKLPACSKWM